MLATRLTTREEEVRLQELLTRHAFLVAPEGREFTLASGRKSRVYFDSKLVTLAPDAFLTIGQLFRQKALELGVKAVGGLASGAIPITMAVIACEAREGRNALRSFYVRSEPKTHGTEESISQAFDPDTAGEVLRPGTRVLIVDDVLTTGRSIGTAVEETRARGADVVAIAVLVDRSEGGAAALREKYGIPVIAVFKADGAGTLTFHDAEVF